MQVGGGKVLCGEKLVKYKKKEWHHELEGIKWKVRHENGGWKRAFPDKLDEQVTYKTVEFRRHTTK